MSKKKMFKALNKNKIKKCISFSVVSFNSLIYGVLICSDDKKLYKIVFIVIKTIIYFLFQ